MSTSMRRKLAAALVACGVIMQVTVSCAPTVPSFSYGAVYDYYYYPEPCCGGGFFDGFFLDIGIWP